MVFQFKVVNSKDMTGQNCYTTHFRLANVASMLLWIFHAVAIIGHGNGLLQSCHSLLGFCHPGDIDATFMKSKLMFSIIRFPSVGLSVKIKRNSINGQKDYFYSM